MYRLIRPVLFRFSAERIHHWAVQALRCMRYIPFAKCIIRKMFSINDPSLNREVFGLKFKNPIGLAAGFDKNGEVANELACFGFGFVEIGSVTPLPQPGNPRPRVFRLPKDRALINRMGINNAGAKQVTKNLRTRKHKIIVGGNISKNSATPNANAAADYERTLINLYGSVDYFALNVSCPNVKELGCLQEVESLRVILEAVTDQRKYHDKYKPILLKLSPDLNASQLEDVLSLVFEYALDGLIVANTTTRREGLRTAEEEVQNIGSGGLSGAPLFQNTIDLVRYISTITKKQLPIIGVGGIFSEDDALQLLDAGASLVQVYTGFVYNGPGFVKRILKKLVSSNTKQYKNTSQTLN
ncbi:MAG: quinone-dependent dihydroorotate dehydrogenase [Prevotellaceae bacterium]|jgi:dihydroorotate dehydrogenase|nr:quinone-dependent dihydroorotate dehydrogenase [Prevotellaceae bacterium]